MDTAAKPRFAIVFLMLLTVCLSLGLSAEDVMDSVYDESEALPYEAIPLFSTVTPLMAGGTIQLPLSSLPRDFGGLPRLAPAHIRTIDARGSADTSHLSTLPGVLLC